MENFYKTVYSSQISEDTFNDSAPLFLNCNNIKRLDGEQQKTCEGLITEEECLSALKQFSKNKTPGSDGLSAEFYLCFWDYVSRHSSLKKLAAHYLAEHRQQNCHEMYRKAARESLANVNRQRSNRLCNRFIGENIRLISDVIESYEGKNLPGM